MYWNIINNGKTYNYNPRLYKHRKDLSQYNHNVYCNGLNYIREECDDDDTFYYKKVDCNDKEIQYLGMTNFSIFDSNENMIILDDYYC